MGKYTAHFKLYFHSILIFKDKTVSSVVHKYICNDVFMCYMYITAALV